MRCRGDRNVALHRSGGTTERPIAFDFRLARHHRTVEPLERDDRNIDGSSGDCFQGKQVIRHSVGKRIVTVWRLCAIVLR